MFKGYKGFNPGLICNPNGKEFQFEEGKTYEEDKAIPCQTGFHYCKNPLAVLDYYPLIDRDGKMNEFTEVEASDEITDDNKKFVTKKIKIGAKLKLKGIIDASVEFIKSETKVGDKVQVSSGYSAQLASSGHSAKLVSSGDYAKLVSSGYSAQLASSGHSAQLASSGDSAQLASSGHSAKLASSGDYAKLAMSGKNSVGANIGYGGQISGIIGSWITLAEYDDNGLCICVKSGKIDGFKLKENVMYELKNGKFEEVI